MNANKAAKSIANDKIETSEVWWPYCRGLNLPRILTLNRVTQLVGFKRPPNPNTNSLSETYHQKDTAIVESVNTLLVAYNSMSQTTNLVRHGHH